ncbi:hypothetical protein PISL3812_05060 [Talaromyces islandicus]|uniref:Uncharacterized protein n=1 Tax=Talaromyces islandicus TaxID=28573 RepID=A0A0U1LXM7_TALIS|nr:hypothetical protein PISL3812_05060 [Talaromyces islandicus]
MDGSTDPNTELEGSTLGRNSRDDGNSRSRLPSQTSSSGGFLLESAYPSSSRRSASDGYHPQLRNGRDSKNSGKRKPVGIGDEITVSKKRTTPLRGRKQQHQHEETLKTSPLAAVTNASASEDQSDLYNNNNTSTTGPGGARASNPPAAATAGGLDTDPAQIVNLALNLSESRRRSNIGRAPSTSLSNARRNVSNSAGLFVPPSDIPQRSVSGFKRTPRHPSTIMQDESFVRKAHPTILSSHDTSASVSGFLPESEQFDGELRCSDATIARVAKAKDHFELFSLYLQLLSHLPPLAHSDMKSLHTTNPGRAYNPLQSIRNRKLRFREKRQIDIESEGWKDVGKVERWLDSIETAHGHNVRDPYQCLDLPRFNITGDGNAQADQGAPSVTESRSSSVRGNHTGPKLQRPRLEWDISPAELLADAAWLEYDLNKAKVVDSNGEKLYPDTSKLKPVSGKTLQHESLSDISIVKEKKQLPTGHSVTLPNFEKSRPSSHSDRSHRGRKLRNALHIPQNTNIPDGTHVPRWTRSNSTSSESSSFGVISRGRTRKSKWERRLNHKFEKPENTSGAPSQRSESSKPSATASAPAVASQPVPLDIHDHADKGHGLISPAGSVAGKEDHRMSLEDMDSTAPNSPVQGPIFPSITANLSPPSSRSPSPRKRLPRVIGSLNERTRNIRHSFWDQGENIDAVPLDTEFRNRKDTATDSSPKDTGSPKALEPSLLPEPPYSQDEATLGNLRRSETHGLSKYPSNYESKLKGFLKGSRIAEIVGSEVTKVGDRIRRRDGGGHSRQSSYASSFVSDYRDSDDEKSDGESKPERRKWSRREPTFSDYDSGNLSQKQNGRRLSKSSISNMPALAPPIRLDSRGDLSDLDSLSPRDSRRLSSVHFTRVQPNEASASSPDITSYSDRRNSYGLGTAFNALESNRVRKFLGRGNGIPVQSVPTKPPVTGLASADPSAAKRPHVLSEESRAWSISDRSIPKLSDSTTVEKREISRCQALLLSSGIKAREIVCRAHEPRDPPPDFLVRSLITSDAPVPRIPRIDEFSYAARNLLERFENTKAGLNKSVYRFTRSGLAPLAKDVDNLEHLINESLTPRVRAAAMEAESFSTQLNTTSTLAIKQLSDALDKGLRKRNRRFRTVRRVGFVLLEWVLVGVMWWVWLVVMVFKIFRGILHGTVASIRWILWL